MDTLVQKAPEFGSLENGDEYEILSDAKNIEAHVNLLFHDDDPVLIWQKDGERSVTLFFENKKRFLELLWNNEEFLKSLSYADTYIAIAVLDKEKFMKDRNCEPLEAYKVIYHCRHRNQSKHARGFRALVLDFDCENCRNEVEQFCDSLNDKGFSCSLASSGRGFHIYVKLNDLLPPEEWKRLQEMLIEVAKRHVQGVDEKIKDPARVMRLIGTYNWKEDQPRRSYWIKYDKYPPIASDKDLLSTLRELLGKDGSQKEKKSKRDGSAQKIGNGSAIACKDIERSKPVDDLSKILELLPPADEIADGKLSGNVPFFGEFTTSRHEVAMDLACIASLAGIERNHIEEIISKWLNDDSKFRVVRSSQIADQYKVCDCDKASSRAAKALNALDTKLFSSIYLFLSKKKGLSEDEALIEASKRVAQIERIFGLGLKSRRGSQSVPRLNDSLEIESCNEYPILKLYTVAKLGQVYSKRAIKETLRELGWEDLFPVSHAPFRIHLNEKNVIRFLIERYELEEGTAKSLVERIRNVLYSKGAPFREVIEGFNNVFLLNFSENVTMVKTKSKNSRFSVLMAYVPKRLFVLDGDDTEEYLIELSSKREGGEFDEKFGPLVRERLIERLRTLNISSKRNIEAIFNDLLESLLRGSSREVEVVRAPWHEPGVYWYKGKFVAYELEYNEKELEEAVQLLFGLREYYLNTLDVFWTVVKWGLASRLFYAIKKRYYESIPMLLLTGRSRAGKSSLARVALAIGGGEEKKPTTKSSFANALSSSITPLMLDEAEDVLRRVREDPDWMSMVKSVFSEELRATAFSSASAKRTMIMTANEEYFFIPQLARRIIVVKFPEIERKGSEEFEALIRKKRKLNVLGLWASRTFLEKELWEEFSNGGWKRLADMLVKELLERFNMHHFIEEALQWRILDVEEQKELEREEVLITIREELIKELNESKRLYEYPIDALQNMTHFRVMFEGNGGSGTKLFVISGATKLLKKLNLQLTPPQLAEIMNGEYYERKKINGKSLRTTIVVRYEDLPEQIRSIIESFISLRDTSM